MNEGLACGLAPFSVEIDMSETKKGGRPKVYKVAKDDAIHDGHGGFFKKGDVLPKGADIESLKAKGLIE